MVGGVSGCVSIGGRRLGGSADETVLRVPSLRETLILSAEASSVTSLPMHTGRGVSYDLSKGMVSGCLRQF